MAKVRPARHYQHPEAPVRRLADKHIPAVARAFRQALDVARRQFDVTRAAQLLADGMLYDVPRLVNWAHAEEAARRPLNMLGNVWLDGGEIGERRLNGAFTSHRRVVRFRKAAATQLERTDRGGSARLTTPISDAEMYLSSVLMAKDQADLFNYDRFDPVTQVHIRAFQDALIAQLGVDSRAIIERVILNAMRTGTFMDVNDLARQVKAVIGLTERQAQAVLRYRRQLMEMDPAVTQRALASTADKALFQQMFAMAQSLSMEQIDGMVERYESAYLASRAQSIAVTETTRAASLGLQDSYDQAVRRGALPAEAVRQYWQVSLDEKLCSHCLSVVDMNPDGVQLGELFQSDEGLVEGPPYHPNCRCSLEFVTNLDLVPDDSEM